MIFKDEDSDPVSIVRTSCVIIDVHTCSCVSTEALGDAIWDVRIALNQIHIFRTISRRDLLSKSRNVEIEFWNSPGIITLQSDAEYITRLIADLDACMIVGDTSFDCNRLRSSVTYLCVYERVSECVCKYFVWFGTRNGGSWYYVRGSTLRGCPSMRIQNKKYLVICHIPILRRRISIVPWDKTCQDTCTPLSYITTIFWG